MGVQRDLSSTYRVKGFKQTNKLYSGNPINRTITNVGDYHFYWFTDSSAVTNQNAYWQYEVAVNV